MSGYGYDLNDAKDYLKKATKAKESKDRKTLDSYKEVAKQMRKQCYDKPDIVRVANQILSL